MSAGLGTLTELKARLNPQLTGTKFDSALTQIGRGVAALFDTFLNRTLRGGAAVVDEFTGDRTFWIARCYPILEINSVEIYDDITTGWVAESLIANQIQSLGLDSGMVRFHACPGTHLTRVRINYSGGYWWDQTGSQTNDDGLADLPGDLKEAWFQMVKHIADNADLIGANIVTASDSTYKGPFHRSEIPPGIREMLNPHRRMALS